MAHSRKDSREGPWERAEKRQLEKYGNVFIKFSCHKYFRIFRMPISYALRLLAMCLVNTLSKEVRDIAIRADKNSHDLCSDCVTLFQTAV